MLKISCRIVEGNVDGWDVHFPGCDVVNVRAASLALDRVCSIVSSLPESSILSIEWEPRTPIGRSVVKVITD